MPTIPKIITAASIIGGSVISVLFLFFILASFDLSFPVLPIALFVLGLAIVSPVSALSSLLFLLPLYGDRPGSIQSFYLFLLSCALNTGFLIRFYKDRRQFLERVNYRNPILLLASLYLAVSFLSLSSLPYCELITGLKSQLTSWTDLSGSAYNIIRFVRSTEEQISYPLVSVIWTIFSFNLTILTWLLVSVDPRNAARLCAAVLYGLLFSLFAGLLDYYNVIDLNFMRSLDPVVNPGGVQFRMQSFFGHSGWFAEYVTLAVPFTMVLLFKNVSFALKIGMILLVLLAGELSLILSFQRGGWISYPLTLLIVWISIYTYRRLDSKEIGFFTALKGSSLKVLVSIPITLIITVLIFMTLNRFGLINSNPDALFSRYIERFGQITKSSDRTDFMKAGFMIGSLYPFLGGGSESFAYHFNREFNTPTGRYFRRLNLPLYGSSHNFYMQIFSGKGVAGLLLILAIIGYTILSSFKLVLFDLRNTTHEKIILLIVASFCFAFLIYGNVQELFYIQVLQYLFFIVLGIAAALQYGFFDLNRINRRKIYGIIAIFIIAHFTWLYLVPRDLSIVKEYGCFNRELDENGEEFRWCGVEAVRKLPLVKTTDGYRADFSIETALLQTKHAGSKIEIYFGEALVHELAIKPGTRYKIGFELPESLMTGKEHYFKFISGAYFIPARDIKRSDDLRILSYKMYLR